MKIKELNNLVLVWGIVTEKSLSILSGNTVLVAENRPYLYGISCNLPLLKKHNLPFIYCTDNMIGHLFWQKKIKETVLFYQGKKKNKFILPCGSLYVALLSRYHKVPLKVFAAEGCQAQKDKDASSLSGRAWVAEDGKKWVLTAAAEEISEEELNGL